MANIAVWKVNFNGEVRLQEIHLSPMPTSLDSASERLPGGAYTTFRTFNSTYALHLDAHLKRLAETARLANASVEFPQGALRLALREAVGQHSSPEKRVRLTLDLEDRPGTVYIEIEPLKTPSEKDYRQGVSAVTTRIIRENPKAKLTSFIHKAGEVRKTLPKGINEALIVNGQNHILEGLSSNFFAVKAGEIWTAEEGVLSGITRSMVLEEARKAGYTLHLESISLDFVPDLDEAFITSSSRAVLPLVRLDSTQIDSGHPGPVTQYLLKLYHERIQREIERI